MREEFDFESIKNKDRACAPLLESILNAALEGEMDTLFPKMNT